MVVQVQFGSVTFFQCHFRSCKSLAIFWLKTSYWNKIERRGWSHRVQSVKTCRLIYILTFCHHLALRERKLTSKFDLDLSKLTIDVSSVSITEEGRLNYCSSFFRSTLFHNQLHNNFGSFRSVLVIEYVQTWVWLRVESWSGRSYVVAHLAASPAG